MKAPRHAAMLLAGFCFIQLANGFVAPSGRPLPNLDKRGQLNSPGLPAEKAAAVEQLRNRLPSAHVDFDALLLSPRMVFAADGFLTGPNAQGRGIAVQPPVFLPLTDPHRATKLFLGEHRALFGYGPEALDAAESTSSPRFKSHGPRANPGRPA